MRILSLLDCQRRHMVRIPPKKMFSKWAQVPNEKKNVIFARGAELLQSPMVGNGVDTHSGLVPQ